MASADSQSEVKIAMVASSAPKRAEAEELENDMQKAIAVIKMLISWRNEDREKGLIDW